MRVTHVMEMAERPGMVPFAGAETHLFALMEGQARAGCGVELVPLVQAEGPVFRAKFEELRAQGISVYPQYVGASRNWRLNLRLIRDLRPFFKSRRDRVVHTHLDGADYIGRMAAWLAGCRLIVSTNHNNEPFYQQAYWRIKLRLLNPWNRHYIAISRAIAGHLTRNAGIAPGKVTVIPYGVTPPGKMRTRQELRRELGLPAEAFVVGFVGRLEPQKNLGLLLEAVRGLAGVQAALVGAGSLEEDLRKQAAGAANVSFLGYRPDAPDLMAAFDLFCLPSRWEGLGLVLLEAMVRGVPIAGSTAGAIPEILGQGRYGLLFDPEAADQLRDRIERSRQNPAESLARAEAAREHARREYSLEAMVERTLAVYRAVGATSGGSAHGSALPGA